MFLFKNLFSVFYKFKDFLAPISKKFLIFSFFVGFSGGIGTSTAKNLGFWMITKPSLSQVGETRNINWCLSDDSDYYSSYDFEEDYIFSNWFKENEENSRNASTLQLTVNKVSLQKA